MANSSIIGKIKNKIAKSFIKDENIVKAINSSQVDSPEKLIGTHIFTYHQNPNTINTIETFITIQVHIPQNIYIGESFVNPSVEIWIISHEKHMPVNNIPKITDNRNDYISKLIDKKLNGQSGYGIGKLTLISNVEGAYQQDYVYRKMMFKVMDLNNSLCDSEVD